MTILVLKEIISRQKMRPINCLSNFLQHKNHHNVWKQYSSNKSLSPEKWMHNFLTFYTACLITKDSLLTLLYWRTLDYGKSLISLVFTNMGCDSFDEKVIDIWSNLHNEGTLTKCILSSYLLEKILLDFSFSLRE